jgi:hypothetical protein
MRLRRGETFALAIVDLNRLSDPKPNLNLKICFLLEKLMDGTSSP